MTRKHSHVWLSVVFGAIWAMFHHLTPLGWFILTRQTWLAVVIGCGGNLIIAYPFVERESWLKVAQIFVGSSIAVAGRSLYGQLEQQEKETEKLWQLLK